MKRFFVLFGILFVAFLLLGCPGRKAADSEAGAGATPTNGHVDIDNLENITLDDPYLPDVSLPEPDSSLGQ